MLNTNTVIPLVSVVDRDYVWYSRGPKIDPGCEHNEFIVNVPDFPFAYQKINNKTI